jgi:uncharacterized protein YdbL (DUF1318 family)
MSRPIVTRRSFIAAVLGVALLPCAWAGAAPTEKELQERFKERFPQIAALKKAGTIGETYEGYLEVVDENAADKEVKTLVEQENEDRKALYKLIADKEGTTVEKVAERAAKRAFEKAKPGEYLKGSDGTWKKKEAAAAR